MKSSKQCLWFLEAAHNSNISETIVFGSNGWPYLLSEDKHVEIEGWRFVAKQEDGRLQIEFKQEQIVRTLTLNRDSRKYFDPRTGASVIPSNIKSAEVARTISGHGQTPAIIGYLADMGIFGPMVEQLLECSEIQVKGELIEQDDNFGQWRADENRSDQFETIGKITTYQDKVNRIKYIVNPEDSEVISSPTGSLIKTKGKAKNGAGMMVLSIDDDMAPKAYLVGCKKHNPPFLEYLPNAFGVLVAEDPKFGLALLSQSSAHSRVMKWISDNYDIEMFKIRPDGALELFFGKDHQTPAPVLFALARMRAQFLRTKSISSLYHPSNFRDRNWIDTMKMLQAHWIPRSQS